MAADCSGILVKESQVDLLKTVVETGASTRSAFISTPSASVLHVLK